nr:hypothetical protein [Tanacetum cinerariifolium]
GWYRRYAVSSCCSRVWGTTFDIITWSWRHDLVDKFVYQFQSFYRYRAKNDEQNKMTRLVAALCFKAVTGENMKATTFFCIMFQGRYWRKYECRAIIMFRVPVPNIKATTF